MRLGHPAHHRLRQVVPGLHFESFHCESCELGKHHRASYKSSTSVESQSLFDLVHCDIWGPARISSVSGFNYYLVLIDDYSRVSWVHLLKDRRGISVVLESFFKLIKTQFDKSIKVFQSDNALEFMQQSVIDLCSSYGTIHQTSCPHTSPQNGVAERKHRHILDVARTLMFASKTPSYLWSDAVLTAVYLINRMPSAPLNGGIPLSRLYPDKPLFPLPPKIFGCVAFVHNHAPGLDKLAPRSIKGVFVGYSTTQKGYRVYIPASRRYIVSRDVTFFEEQPFFESATSPPSPSPSTPMTRVPLPLSVNPSTES